MSVCARVHICGGVWYVCVCAHVHRGVLAPSTGALRSSNSIAVTADTLPGQVPGPACPAGQDAMREHVDTGGVWAVEAVTSTPHLTAPNAAPSSKQQPWLLEAGPVRCLKKVIASMEPTS